MKKSNYLTIKREQIIISYMKKYLRMLQKKYFYFAATKLSSEGRALLFMYFRHESLFIYTLLSIK